MCSTYYWAQNGRNITGCVYQLIAYGNYLEAEAQRITETRILVRDPIPNAVFCANDGMAAAVCDTLQKHGLRVPKDVIVTGFDGTETAYLCKPQLTTCDSDYPGQAALILERIRRFYETGESDAVYKHPFRPVLAASCGCASVISGRLMLMHDRQQSEWMYNFENTLFYQVDQMLMEKKLYPFLAMLGAFILPDSALYLNKSILNINPDTEYQVDHPEDELIMVPHCKPGEQPSLCQVYLKDMPLPNAGSGVTVLNIVHAGERVCGYFAAHSEDISMDFRLIKRVSDILNLLASGVLSHIWQRQLEAKLENNLYTDFIVDLPNLKGLSRWYDAFAANEAHHSRAIALTVYGIPNDSTCYETCGMAVTEEIVCTVSTALRSAYPDAEQIARISEDQFAVLSTADSEEALDAQIQQASAA
ncbi:MAG: GGDEF domain-containing protein [Oscillospiraceae bacterium]|nr:GGDEF domain-containing protein [Oscillospiraceae bacterium]